MCRRRSRLRNRSPTTRNARRGCERSRSSRRFLEQHREQIGKRAVLEREVGVHVGFAKPEIAEREHTVEHAVVADIDGDGWGHVQASRDPHVGATPDGDAGVGQAAVQQRQKQAGRSDRRAVADPVMHERAPHRE